MKKDQPLKPKQEMFSRYYTQNDVTLSNGVAAYAAAYGFELDELWHEAVIKSGKYIDREPR